MPDRVPVVVLAGGSSRRFHGDKLRARWDGSSVLARVVSRVSPLASEVLLATSSPERAAELIPELSEPVRPLYDQPERWGHGPAAAMASARASLGDGPVLFVPGDVPWIEATALRRLVTRASLERADVAVPVWSSGETEHLLQWQRSATVLSYLPWNSAAPVPTSWRASEFLRAVPRTVLVSVSRLTSRPGTFSHVTYAKDLVHPAARGTVDPGAIDLRVEGEPKRSYATAHAAQLRGDSARAGCAFTRESRWYGTRGLALLSQHAAADAAHAMQTEPPNIPPSNRPWKLSAPVHRERAISIPSGE